MERRKSALLEGAIDWGTAEALAFASLITQGHPIRLTGQDTVRGTFSHRHLAFHDEINGELYIPMQHLTDAQATFEVLNSPLSEVGCLGFEYGYSAADPETLVIWEAQYGDFFNNAEMIVDQFVSSARAKWGQHSRLTMLLPHGYEGSGPEHSSARIERFLQLSANDNMRLVNCTTPAQYFHLLRSQGLLGDPRPLVVFTPKSLLRLKELTSKLADLSSGRFQPVIDDPTGSERRDEVRTLLLCSGRIYYELTRCRNAQRRPILPSRALNNSIPSRSNSILDLVASYPNLERLFWVQEEPQNMGSVGEPPARNRRGAPIQHRVGLHRQAGPRQPLGRVWQARISSSRNASSLKHSQPRDAESTSLSNRPWTDLDAAVPEPRTPRHEPSASWCSAAVPPVMSLRFAPRNSAPR